MIVLDASVLIAFLDGDDHFHRRAHTLLVDQIDEDLAVNSLTLAEVLVAPARQNQLETVRNALTDLEVHELSFPADSAVKLALLRATTRLKMPDCCVLLAAEEEQAHLATFDDRLFQAATARNLTAISD